MKPTKEDVERAKSDFVELVMKEIKVQPKHKPIRTKANPYLVVIILTIIGWCVAMMLTGGCSIDDTDLDSPPPETRCSGVSVLTCLANTKTVDGGAD